MNNCRFGINHFQYGCLKKNSSTGMRNVIDKSRLQNYLGLVFSAVLWFTMYEIRSKLMTVCQNEDEE